MAASISASDDNISPSIQEQELVVKYREFLNRKLTRKTVFVLHEHLKSLNKDWYKVGLSLKVPIETLDAIDEDKREVFRKAVAMIVEWIDNMESSWIILFDALSRNGQMEIVKSILSDNRCHKLDQTLVDLTSAMEIVQAPYGDDMKAKIAAADQQYRNQCQKICQIYQIPCSDELIGQLDKATEKLLSGLSPLDNLKLASNEVNMIAKIAQAKVEMTVKYSDILQARTNKWSQIREKIAAIKSSLMDKQRELAHIKSKLATSENDDDTCSRSKKLIAYIEVTEREIRQTKSYLQYSMEVLDKLEMEGKSFIMKLDECLQHIQTARKQNMEVYNFANSCSELLRSVNYGRNLFRIMCLMMVFLAIHHYYSDTSLIAKIAAHTLWHIITFTAVERVLSGWFEQLAPGTQHLLLSGLYVPIGVCKWSSVKLIWPTALIITGYFVNLSGLTYFHTFGKGGVVATILASLLCAILQEYSDDSVTLIVLIILFSLIGLQILLSKAFPNQFSAETLHVDMESFGLITSAILGKLGDYFVNFGFPSLQFVGFVLICLWLWAFSQRASGMLNIIYNMLITFGTYMFFITKLFGYTDSEGVAHPIAIAYSMGALAGISVAHNWAVSYNSPSSPIEHHLSEYMQWQTGSIEILNNTQEIITKLKCTIPDPE